MDETLPVPAPLPVTSRLVGQVLVLTLNRPTVRNAINLAMVDGLARELDLAEQNPNVRCVILTGSGEAFSSGGDVHSMGEPVCQRQTLDTSVGVEQLQRGQRVTALRLHQFPKPTVAAIGGAAVGAGFSWALACDLRVMADTAFLSTSFARLGLSGDHGGLFFLARLVGPAKALELFLLSPRIPAMEALSLGLTNWTCPAAELTAKSMEVAMQLADGPPVAQRFIKENLRLAESAADPADYLNAEAVRQIASMQTEDFREAMEAFRQKRSPRFFGR